MSAFTKQWGNGKYTTMNEAIYQGLHKMKFPYNLSGDHDIHEAKQWLTAVLQEYRNAEHESQHGNE